MCRGVVDKPLFGAVVTVERVAPFVMRRFVDERNQLAQGLGGVGVYGGRGVYVFVEFGAVDVDVEDFGVRGVMPDNAGDAVVESHADGYDKVGAVGVDVGADVAVHSEHAFEEGM